MRFRNASSLILQHGFTMIELMISLVLLSGIVAGSMVTLNKFRLKQTVSSLESKQKEQMSLATVKFTRDIENATFFTGSTTSTTFFEGVRTYGLLPYPFADRGLNSDGIQILTTNESLSETALYEVTSITNNVAPGVAEIRLSGDFTPTRTLTEDLFLMTDGRDVELFKVYGSISFSGGTSTLRVAQTVPSNMVTYLGSEYNPKVYRIQRVIYKIGHGDQSTGLYRGISGPNGSFELAAADAESMTIQYLLQSQPAEYNSADCAAKNQSRWFAHDTSGAQCNWNDIHTVMVNITFFSASEEGAEAEKSFSISITPLAYARLIN